MHALHGECIVRLMLGAALLGLALLPVPRAQASYGGRLAAWGDNHDGELGRGTPDAQPHPRPQPVLALDGVVAVSGGVGDTLALRRDGTVWAWGRNESGQLGDGTTTPRAVPGQVRYLRGGDRGRGRGCP
jgi:hypothetical protein